MLQVKITFFRALLLQEVSQVYCVYLGPGSLSDCYFEIAGLVIASFRFL